jgi:hypothetical protein
MQTLRDESRSVNPTARYQATVCRTHLFMAFCTTALVLAAPVSAQQIYKWVDENGKTHYSESPPDKGKAKKVEPPASAPTSGVPPKSARSTSELELEFRQRQTARAEAARKEEAEEEKQRRDAKRECIRARNQLEELRQQVPLYTLNEKGERVYLTDKERKTDAEDAAARVAKYCKDS